MFYFSRAGIPEGMKGSHAHLVNFERDQLQVLILERCSSKNYFSKKLFSPTGKKSPELSSLALNVPLILNPALKSNLWSIAPDRQCHLLSHCASSSPSRVSARIRQKKNPAYTRKPPSVRHRLLTELIPPSFLIKLRHR